MVKLSTSQSFSETLLHTHGQKWPPLPSLLLDQMCVVMTFSVPFTPSCLLLLLLLLNHFSHVRLCVTPWTAAHQAPPTLGFSRQEHWSGLPFSSPMHESEKWKWSNSVMSDSSWPHRLQPTRLLPPWDFPGKSTGVGCHCLLWWPYIQLNIYNPLSLWQLELFFKKQIKPLRSRNPVNIAYHKSLIQDSVKRKQTAKNICKDLNIFFTEEGIQMASKHMKYA